MRIPPIAIPYYIITIIYSSLIFYYSSQESIGGTGMNPLEFDKANHLLEYFILGFLVYLCFHYSLFEHRFLGKFYNTKIMKDSIASILIGSLYGVSDEIHQYFVPGRTGDPFDVVADCLGVSFGVFIAIQFQFYKARLITRESTKGEVEGSHEH